LELVRRARNLAHRFRTPIVMLSASPVEAAAREAGANVFLQKPRDVVSLIETVTRYVSTWRVALREGEFMRRRIDFV
jgi:CheY-like chemotaxis protein